MTTTEERDRAREIAALRDMHRTDPRSLTHAAAEIVADRLYEIRWTALALARSATRRPCRSISARS